MQLKKRTLGMDRIVCVDGKTYTTVKDIFKEKEELEA